MVEQSPEVKKVLKRYENEKITMYIFIVLATLFFIGFAIHSDSKTDIEKYIRDKNDAIFLQEAIKQEQNDLKIKRELEFIHRAYNQ